jgi:hypothetical protein
MLAVGCSAGTAHPGSQPAQAGTQKAAVPSRQGGHTSKVAWQDQRAIAAGAGKPTASDRGGTEFGGGIEVFPTVAAATQRLAYLKSFQPPLGDGYDYQSGTVILRLSNYLTPAQAHAYQAAFATPAPMH